MKLKPVDCACGSSASVRDAGGGFAEHDASVACGWSMGKRECGVSIEAGDMSTDTAIAAWNALQAALTAGGWKGRP